MKVILTGATGFVGGEVLAQLLASSRLERVTCLTRRPLEASDARVATIVMPDFTTYDDALAARLRDHDAVIWTLGGKASDFEALEEYERVTHGFALALAHALAPGAGARLAFCYLSGMGADPSESSRLPWERTTRHLKGRTERDLFALAQRYQRFHAYSLRPGGILPRAGARLVRLALAPLAIGVEQVAAGLIAAATRGDLPKTRVFENSEIKRLMACA